MNIQHVGEAVGSDNDERALQWHAGPRAQSGSVLDTGTAAASHDARHGVLYVLVWPLPGVCTRICICRCNIKKEWLVHGQHHSGGGRFCRARRDGLRELGEYDVQKLAGLVGAQHSPAFSVGKQRNLSIGRARALLGKHAACGTLSDADGRLRSCCCVSIVEFRLRHAQCVDGEHVV